MGACSCSSSTIEDEMSREGSARSEGSRETPASCEDGESARNARSVEQNGHGVSPVRVPDGASPGVLAFHAWINEGK